MCKQLCCSWHSRMAPAVLCCSEFTGDACPLPARLVGSMCCAPQQLYKEKPQLSGNDWQYRQDRGCQGLVGDKCSNLQFTSESFLLLANTSRKLGE